MKKTISLFLAAWIPLSGGSIPVALATEAPRSDDPSKESPSTIKLSEAEQKQVGQFIRSFKAESVKKAKEASKVPAAEPRAPSSTQPDQIVPWSNWHLIRAANLSLYCPASDCGLYGSAVVNDQHPSVPLYSVDWRNCRLQQSKPSDNVERSWLECSASDSHYQLKFEQNDAGSAVGIKDPVESVTFLPIINQVILHPIFPTRVKGTFLVSDVSGKQIGTAQRYSLPKQLIVHPPGKIDSWDETRGGWWKWTLVRPADGSSFNSGEDLYCRTSECGKRGTIFADYKPVPLYTWQWKNCSLKDGITMECRAKETPYHLTFKEMESGRSLENPDGIKGAWQKYVFAMKVRGEFRITDKDGKSVTPPIKRYEFSDWVLIHTPKIGTGPRPGEPGTQPPGQSGPGKNPAEEDDFDKALTNLRLKDGIEKAMAEYFVTGQSKPDEELERWLKKNGVACPGKKNLVKQNFICTANDDKKKDDLAKFIRERIMSKTMKLLEDEKHPDVNDSNWLKQVDENLATFLDKKKLTEDDLLTYFCGGRPGTKGYVYWRRHHPDTSATPGATTGPSSNLVNMHNPLDTTRAEKQVAQEKTVNAIVNADKAKAEPEDSTQGGNAVYGGAEKDPPIFKYCRGYVPTENSPVPSQLNGGPDLTLNPPPLNLPGEAKPTSKKPGEDKDKNEQMQKDIMGGIYGMAGFGLIGLAMFGPPGFVAGLAVGAIVGALVVHLSFK